ncbi:serum response factor homolog B-like [Belonocnema kinseyi]|uniref:serum response factor homolog B-like n=1 Tax=Belonocnema kinseyi TaxID=2817044 RepID=UPI00143E0309|nr:serum response factor homolog B-like [Belonocnema kinseyi]
MPKFIRDREKRLHIFSTKKSRLLSRAYKLSTLTGTQVLVIIQSENGDVYNFATKKFQPVLTSEEGKELIRSCLSSPDSHYETSENEGTDEENNSVSSKSSKSTANTAGEDPEDIDTEEKKVSDKSSLWSRFKSLWL